MGQETCTKSTIWTLPLSILFVLSSPFLVEVVKFTQVPIPFQLLNITVDGHYETVVSRDLSINHPYLDNSRVSVGLGLLLCIGILMPLLVILFVGCILSPKLVPTDADEALPTNAYDTSSDSDVLVAPTAHTAKKTLDHKDDTIQAISCFFFAVGTTEILTSGIKLYVGRLRPNFYAMCEFSDETLQCETADDLRLTECRKSFPSGHSSLSFCACTFLALYLSYKLIEGPGGMRYGQGWNLSPAIIDFLSLLIFAVPISLSSYVAASRVHDWWHHVGDVVAGSLLGAVVSTWCFGYLYMVKKKRWVPYVE